ncbi:uncharacterized protein LOC110643510 [Hevea brasiliensis]|uniref:uncharacterized protein LOC110643510 n=1 Tax=Hevea brasiliensis TaxID=3981 RepID=UPI0025F97892|nr:uncharacterized protein LOC110643510 [Hevea brasiliensis]
MVPEDSPEELPDGWTVQFNVLKTGRKIKYYVNSGTGQKFFSKDDFICHIKAQSTQLNQPQPAKSSIRRPTINNQMHQIMEDTNEHPEWLPHGWIVELRTRQSGFASGKIYKCYVDISTGCKFYSKPEVLRYLETVKQKSCTLKQKETLMSVLPENKPSSEAKMEKQKHTATGQQLCSGKGTSDVGSTSSSEAESLKKSGGKTVSTVTTLTAVATIDIPSQEIPRDNVEGNGAECKENYNGKWSAQTKAEVSERNQDKTISPVGGHGLLFPEADNKQEQNLPESGTRRDESYKRKAQNSLSKFSNKKSLYLPRCVFEASSCD